MATENDEFGRLHAELFETLSALVTSGRAFCPISAPTFLEVMKQSDLATRAKTVEFVDQLSLGAALCVEHERIATEVAYTLHEFGDSVRAPLHPLRHLVWVRLLFLLGGFVPTSAPGAFAEPWVVDKAFLDQCCRQTLGSNSGGGGEIDLLRDVSESL